MREQQVFQGRRNYNRWVANQTLEDYALRFTAKSARRWSLARVSNTALGAISFLALEAIGGAITINYGFENAFTAILAVSVVIFLTGLPICYYAARYGVDIDLLSRGASFGYIGSTITSLIYASFTFIFFALEAAILSSALQMLFGIPVSIGYLISSLAIIPLAIYGITFISRFQLWSQPLWVVLQLIPFVFIFVENFPAIEQWTEYGGLAPQQGSDLNLIFFGAASVVLFSLIAQIGEQVDFLRFLPKPDEGRRTRWWLAMVSAGPGWILVGAVKILAGSFLAYLAIHHGVSELVAGDPTQMYLVAFSYITHSPQAALALAGIFVIVCQLKINVTNAYAGSIAWSNFFSRLTHSHPGRVVWLVFNVMIALLLMELGIYNALEKILGVYSTVAVAWVGALSADLLINKTLGYSPKHIEFKRAHLYDINPVGFGTMIISSSLGILSYGNAFGETVRALAPYIALISAFVISPLIAIATQGRYYIARHPQHNHDHHIATCNICQNAFETEDMTTCPAYGGSICSLCCSIDSHCHDQCKAGAKFSDQLTALLSWILPVKVATHMDARLVQFGGLLTIIGFTIALLFWLVFQHVSSHHPELREILGTSLFNVYMLLIIIVGILTWLFVLANESRQLALKESQRQTSLLSKEILAHEKTDLELQKARDTAEAANQAKSRYLTGISHELRTPLNSILGYAQLLEKDTDIDESRRNKISLIRRSGDHLTALIEGLLDISRIEAGRFEMRREEVALISLINELVEMFRLQAEARGIQFSYIEKTPLPEVVITDEKHLRQILINLLSNAVKYTSEGSVSLSIRYRNQVAEFIVADTGVGIADDEIERIFLPFERIRKPGHPQSPGTGLGLTISKFVTEIMGGEITVKSTPGEGSTFRLSVMLFSVDHPRAVPTPAKVIHSYVGDRKTVMVVDDEAAHRGLISDILTPLGFVVLESEDAAHALSMLHDIDVDLFLLDISMPGMSGWELLETLRGMGVQTPIIMVSADAFQLPRYKSENDESITLHNDYLVKPIRDSILLDKIAQALNLEWSSEPRIDNATETPANVTQGKTQHASIDNCNELIAMAELGYINGINKVLDKIAEDEDNSTFVKQVRYHFERFQFDKIIDLSEQAKAS